MKNLTIPARKRDMLIIKIVDWSDDDADNEPAIDLEVYVNGKFDPDKSKVFPISKGGRSTDSRSQAFTKAKLEAIQILSESHERRQK